MLHLHMIFLDYSNIFQQLSFHNAVTITDISAFTFGLHNNIRRAQPGALPMGAPLAFLLFQALHTGRTYLKNRAQSW